MDAIVMTPEAVRQEMREVYGDEIPSHYVDLLAEWEEFKRNPKANDSERAALVAKLDNTIRPWLDAYPRIRFNVTF